MRAHITNLDESIESCSHIWIDIQRSITFHDRMVGSLEMGFLAKKNRCQFHRLKVQLYWQSSVTSTKSCAHFNENEKR